MAKTVGLTFPKVSKPDEKKTEKNTETKKD